MFFLHFLLFFLTNIHPLTSKSNVSSLDPPPSLMTLVKSHRPQKFKILARKNNVYHQIAIDEDMLVENKLTDWSSENSSLQIQKSGYYEVAAQFHFNPNTSLLGYSRAGINFVICKNDKGKLHIISSKRQTFYSENANEYNSIEIAPAIVYLNEGDQLILCINAGLLEKDMLSAQLGAVHKKESPYSYQFKIEKR